MLAQRAAFRRVHLVCTSVARPSFDPAVLVRGVVDLGAKSLSSAATRFIHFVTNILSSPSSLCRARIPWEFMVVLPDGRRKKGCKLEAI